VIGAIIGVGIFFTPSTVAELAGSAPLAMLAWSLGGAIALVGGLTFAELGGMYPKSGGQYDILRDAYGTPIAFLFVFCNATAIQAGAIAVIAILFAENVEELVVGNDWSAAQIGAIGTAAIIGLALANIVGVRWGSRVQNLTVATKLGALLLIIALAALTTTSSTSGESTSQPETRTLWLGVFAALVPVLFSIGGWQHALWVAGEVRDPNKNVPRAIVGGVVVVIAVYLLANWAYLDLLGFHGVVHADRLAADAVGSVWPNLGSRIVAGAVAISAFGVLNAQLLSGPRLIMAMARDGRFFRVFGQIHPGWKTPVFAIGLLAGIGLTLMYLAGKDGADQILTGVVLVDSTFMLLTGFSLIVLRIRMPNSFRPVRVPLYPLVPALFVLGELAVIIGAFCSDKYRNSSIIGVGWIVAALVIYFAFFSRRLSTGANYTD
jgi:APA family basic amino acid/polyamine antiporter